MSEIDSAQINTDASFTTPEPVPVFTPGAEPVREAGTDPIVQDTKEPTEPVIAGDPVEGAPEAYESFDMGENTLINDEVLGKFKDMAKGLNLPQAKAQELVSLGNELAKSVSESNMKAWNEVREGWVSEIKNDADFGGAKLEGTLNSAKRVLGKFGDKGLQEFLDQGMGDNAGLIKMLAKIDSVLSEDKSPQGGSPSSGIDKSHAEVLYPNG